MNLVQVMDDAAAEFGIDHDLDDQVDNEVDEPTDLDTDGMALVVDSIGARPARPLLPTERAAVAITRALSDLDRILTRAPADKVVVLALVAGRQLVDQLLDLDDEAGVSKNSGRDLRSTAWVVTQA